MSVPMSRRAAAATLVIGPAAFVIGCDCSCDETAGQAPPATDAHQVPTPNADDADEEQVVTLSSPATPVDPKFSGCARGCGVKFAYDREAVVIQPTANHGDLAYCPVSGAVFAVDGASARRVHRDRALYFCCDQCAQYFSQNREHVLALRGLES